MSQAERNVALLERLVEAFYARDAETVLSILDPSMQFESALTEGKTYSGAAGLAEYRRDLDEAWTDWRSQGDQFLPVDGERVLHLYRIIGRGRGGGVPVAQDIAILWTIRDHRVVHGKVFLDQADARKAAGPSE